LIGLSIVKNNASIQKHLRNVSFYPARNGLSGFIPEYFIRGIAATVC